MMIRLVSTLLVILALVIGKNLAYPMGNEEMISLYSANDAVIELTDANFTSNVHDPNVVWVVEF